LPVYLPISRILEGGENEVFESYFEGPKREESKLNGAKGSSSSAPSSVAKANWNAKEDAEVLKSAKKWLFTDEEKLISVICHR
jgi:hypothetical protein